MQGAAVQAGLAIGFLGLGQNKVGDLEFRSLQRDAALNPEAIEALGPDVAGGDLDAKFF